jgi:hypothetical protein
MLSNCLPLIKLAVTRNLAPKLCVQCLRSFLNLVQLLSRKVPTVGVALGLEQSHYWPVD